MYIGGRLINDVPPKDRDIAMVFQSYALYPHMTVYKNIAFGLELRKTPKDEIDKRVHEAAKILEIEHLLDRNGDTVRVAFDPHKVHLFDIETEQTILNEAAIM